MLGAVWAILWHPISILLPPSSSVNSASLAALYQLLSLAWGFFVLELSYCLVFKWFPLTRNQHTQQLDKSRQGQITSNQLKVQNPAHISKLLERIRQNPEARLGYQVMSWFVISASIIVLIIGLTTPEHPNPYLFPSLIVTGFEGMLIGASTLLSLGQARIAPWLMLLNGILFVIFLYLLLRVFTYSP